ncbi:hypothetical protein FIC_01641 [Flavobacteriaceae bacterium 3519-10]|nr:hypothetical protein FIC_01641 [Flavobacteriaceae bacterium 3519-10]
MPFCKNNYFCISKTIKTAHFVKSEVPQQHLKPKF